MMTAPVSPSGTATRFGALLLCGLLAAAAAQAQVLCGLWFDRRGEIAWTNCYCSLSPVFEILSAGSVTGQWQRLALVTNQTSFVTTNPAASGEEARFFRLAWLEDGPVDFHYTFLTQPDPDVLCVAVTGRLSLAFSHWRRRNATNATLACSGAWDFSSTAICPPHGYPGHPTGTGTPSGVRTVDVRDGSSTLRLYLGAQTEGNVLLEGTFDTTHGAAGCTITTFHGVASEILFGGGAAPIGYFVADRSPP